MADSIIWVDPLCIGTAYITEVWISDDAWETILEYQRRHEKHQGFFLKKVDYYARGDFRNFLGDEKPIRHEWKQVYRIGHESTLFRLYGFFESNTTFIVLDALMKHGTKLTPGERSTVDGVANARDRQTWRRRTQR